MPFPMKIQPLDSLTFRESIRNDSAKPVLKSRLKRLFDLSSVLAPFSAFPQNPSDPFVDHRSYPPHHLPQDHQIISQRPTSSSLSSTVESFSGPKPPQPAIPQRQHPRSPPLNSDDCHSDYDSSSSVVDDGDGCDIASSSLFRMPLPFDLNLPPPLDDDLHCTDLRL